MTTPRRFARAAVIDWSGEAVARPKGLALAEVDRSGAPPRLVEPEGGWSRQALLDWMLGHAEAASDLVIGVDLSCALPFADHGSYFPNWHHSPPDARSLWALVDAMSQNDPWLSAAGFLADAETRRHFRQHRAPGELFPVGAGRLRITELGQREAGFNPTSCFNLVGAAQVGKSSLTGMRVLHRLQGRVPVWPFDPLPATGPVLVEIYTTIAARAAGVARGRSKVRDAAGLATALATFGFALPSPSGRIDDHATDALLGAAWLLHASEEPRLWSPPGLTRELARTEGWTFGVA